MGTNLHGNSDLSAIGSGACSNIRQASKVAPLPVSRCLQISSNQPQNKQITDVQDFVSRAVRSVEYQQNADHPFSAIYNCYVQCIFHLVRKRLEDDQNLIQLHSLERPFYRVLAAVIVKEDRASRNAKWFQYNLTSFHVYA